MTIDGETMQRFRDHVLEEAAQSVDEWVKSYPTNIFTPPVKGEITDLQVTRQSAETMRVMCPRIANHIREMKGQIDDVNRNSKTS